jgi:pyruvate/2-oxoglutarate dehydrogenase complex dihydrolipoamide acyltransferase (E2) component
MRGWKAVFFDGPTYNLRVSKKEQAKLVRWYKDGGDFVREGESICELETDMVTMDMAAWKSGILWRLVRLGDDVDLGTEVARIDPISN